MGRIYRWLAFGVIISILLGLTRLSVPTAKAAAWQEKVDPWILSTAPEGEAEFLVLMREQADLSGADMLQNKIAKGIYVYETLRSMAEASQKPIRASLNAIGVAYQPFWIANMLWVRGDINIIQQIAQRSDVSHIYANPQVKISLPEPDTDAESRTVNAIEWNLSKINADDVWAEGYTGQGVVIGGQDTGYDWEHPALINQYRGWNGTTASHDYNWYDATGLSPNTPVDPHSHGTHTMGTMVGDDGESNQVGVAPGARWIGCRNMNSSGYGTPATYTACYQWFVAPTRTDGSDPRPDLAPDVINNSWSCPESEGCTEPDMLLAVVQAVRAAGILTAHSAGNNGPYCGTVDEPAAIYAESFSVGSTTSSDTISSFSSRGPVTVDGSNRFKPQVSAPGSSIRSTIPGGGYGNKSGTSMAAPHVAGLTALLISARPALAGQVDELETLIEESALPIYTTTDCGGDTLTSHPNHTYGWGRIDAWAATYLAINPHSMALEKKVSSDVAVPGSVLTYTLTISNNHPISTIHDVIVEDTIPTGTNFVTATMPHTLTGETLSWALGDLITGVDAQVELIVGIPTPIPLGTIVNNQFSARSDEVDTMFGNSVSTTIHKLGVEKSAPQVVAPGYPLTYTLMVTNLQPDAVTHQVVLTDTIPEGTTFMKATGDYSLAGNLVSWKMGNLAAEASERVDLVVSIPLTATGTITNGTYGAVSAEVHTPAKGEAVSTFLQKPGMELSPDQSGMIIDPCSQSTLLTYTHQITNTGNYTDSFNLSINSSLAWATLISDHLTLASGEAAFFDLEIKPVCPILPDAVDITLIKASSLADPTVTKTITNTTTINYRWFLPLTLPGP